MTTKEFKLLWEMQHGSGNYEFEQANDKLKAYLGGKWLFTVNYGNGELSMA